MLDAVNVEISQAGIVALKELVAQRGPWEITRERGRILREVVNREISII